jgi:glycosyltransferase involved in cell wall biosynthesis
MHLRQDRFNDYGYTAPYQTKKIDEITNLKRYDNVFSLNLNEVKYLQQNGVTNAVYLPPNLPFNSNSNNRKDGSFGLIGSMAAPNLDGFLCLGVPITHSDKFVLAGPISTDKQVNFRLGSPVARLGIIEQPSYFYNEIEVALSPIRFGSGLKIKVFEALSFGKPVLATKHSIDGFPKNIKDVISVVDDIASWDLDTIRSAAEIPSTLIKDFFISSFSEKRCANILTELLP